MATERFDLFQDDGGSWRWRLKGANGRKIATSGESFSSRSAAKRAAENVKKRAPNAQVSEPAKPPAKRSPSTSGSKRAAPAKKRAPAPKRPAAPKKKSGGSGTRRRSR